MIVWSTDLDWAPAWATLALCRRFTDAGLPLTVMVTHPCPSLPVLERAPSVELGWHPNFLPGSTHGGSVEAVLDAMARLVPEARGVRAHGLSMSTGLLEAYARRGLWYEGSYLLEGTPGLRPSVAYNGVVRLPIYWEDDVHLRAGARFRLQDVDLGSPGLKVLNVHPIHVALNSRTPHAWEALKASLAGDGTPLWEADPDHVATAATRDGGRGTADLLDALLEWSLAHPGRVAGTMGQVAQTARREAGWDVP